MLRGCFARSFTFRVALCTRAVATSASINPQVLNDVRDAAPLTAISSPDYKDEGAPARPAAQKPSAVVVEPRDDFRDMMTKIDNLITAAAERRSELVAQGAMIEQLTSSMEARTSELAAQGAKIAKLRSEAAARTSELTAQGTMLDNLTSEVAARRSKLAAQGATIDKLNTRLKRLDNNLKREFVRHFPLLAHEQALYELLCAYVHITGNKRLQAKYRKRRRGMPHPLPRKRLGAIKQLELRICKLQSSVPHRELMADAKAVQVELQAMPDDVFRDLWLARMRR